MNDEKLNRLEEILIALQADTAAFRQENDRRHAEAERRHAEHEERLRHQEMLLDALLKSQLRMEEDHREFKRLVASFVKDTMEWHSVAETRFDGLEKKS